MTKKELDNISKKLRAESVPHLLVARIRSGYALSSLATEDDIFEFLQCMIDVNPDVLPVIRAVIESRKKPPKKTILN